MTPNHATLDHQHGDGSAAELDVKVYDLPERGPTVVFVSTCSCGHMTVLGVPAEKARGFAANVMECASAADGGRGVQ